VKFSTPAWFALGIVVLLLAVGYVIAQRRTRKHTLRFANLELLESVAPNRPGRWRHLPTAVVLIGLSLLTIALAGPTADAKEPRNRAVVVLAIDVSLSMQSTDVTPTRLAAAKEAANQFVDDLTKGVNLGIIAFAGVPAVLVSPTTDRATAHAAINNLKLDERTATGEALITALQSIDTFARMIGGAEGPPPARVVLMTDGKRTTGRSEQDAAKMAAAAKVPVSVIAFGTPDGYVEIEGEKVDVPPDEAGMRTIAQISGGDFHTAATSEELKKVYAELGEQIGYEIKQKDVSRPWVIAGVVSMMIGAAGALVLGRRIP
jgi:Ca-activated chloride channel family protein